MPTSSTVTALWIPPAFSKAQGKLRSPAPRADLRRIKMAPREPSLGSAPIRRGDLGETAASRLMLSLSRSSMLRPAGHWRDRSRAPSGQGYREGEREEAAGAVLSCSTGTRQQNLALRDWSAKLQWLGWMENLHEARCKTLLWFRSIGWKASQTQTHVHRICWGNCQGCKRHLGCCGMLINTGWRIWLKRRKTRSCEVSSPLNWV